MADFPSLVLISILVSISPFPQFSFHYKILYNKNKENLRFGILCWSHTVFSCLVLSLLQSGKVSQSVSFNDLDILDIQASYFI